MSGDLLTAGLATTTAGVVWSPLLAWPALAAIAGLGLILVGLGAMRRARGTSWRLIALLGLVVALANPALVREQREPVADVAVLIVDDSPSQKIVPRPEQTQAALDSLTASVAAQDGVELRVLHTSAEEGFERTRLIAALRRALAEVPKRRLAGAIILSDGQAHDAPNAADAGKLAAEIGAPVHLLLTGRAEDGDRRILLGDVPAFGLVGKDASLAFRIDDLPGADAKTAPGPAQVELRLWKDGAPLPPVTVPTGAEQRLTVPIDHAGANLIELEVAPGPRELSLVNNRAAIIVTGVRDRLRVLLVSGEPHPGERTWRSLLKADPEVDLVHFTILRPPEKQDGTPVSELSLIAFPTRELFEVKLDEFDLVIFDRYRRTGVLPPAYFDNIAAFVQNGGALLESAGADFAGPFSLYGSALGDILPAAPTGAVIEGGFRPEVSELGLRHPVTAGLESAGESGEAAGTAPRWGRWFRYVEARAKTGTTVLTAAGRPLLILARVGKGRVAQLLSDQAWLWSRGFEGGGPQSELLRRLAHWLMKEPELEEEDLRAAVADGRLTVTRRSLGEAVERVTVTAPSGGESVLDLAATGPGRAEASMPAPEPGLYRLDDGTRRAFAASGELNPPEYADLRPSAEPLAPLVEASGGGVVRLAEDGAPELRRTQPGRAGAGHGWIGLQANGDYTLKGVEQMPLMPAAAGLLLALGALLAAWWREGR